MPSLLKTTSQHLAIAMPLLLIGCGSGDQPELGMVSGIVTLDGKSLPNVEVTFTPEIGRPSYGETGKDGLFELVYIRDIKGAKVGRHNVTIHSKKVDNSKLKPVEVKAGKNLMSIECVPSSSASAKNAAGDDA